MNVQSIVADFTRDGFVCIENFFEDELTSRMDEVIRGHYGDEPGFSHNEEFLTKGKTEVIPWFPQQKGASIFDEIDSDARLRELTGQILGQGWTNQYCMVMFSRRGTSGQAWHQDCAPDDAGVFNLNRLVYTSDITDEIGGQTVVVPGSYRRGLLLAGDPQGEFPDQKVLRPRKGMLVLLHGHTWHRVLPITGAFRFSTNYRVAPRGTPADITDVCVYRNMRYQFSTARVIEERVAG
jgi:hypothetical protein